MEPSIYQLSMRGGTDMKRYACILLILCLCMLIGPVAAADEIPDQIDISSSNSWPAAGSGEKVTITLRATNTSIPKEISNLKVDFSVLESGMGSVHPASGTTNSVGLVTTSFTPSTTSGTATIRATVHYTVGSTDYTATTDFSQDIDHNTPREVVYLDFESDVTVYEEVPIVVRMADAYGNIVDNRNVAEKVRFSCSPSSATFMSGGAPVGQSLQASVNADGDATAILRVSSRTGENIVYVDPVPVQPPNYWLTIYAVGETYPWEIDAVITPPGLELPADGTSRFVVTYVLHDRFGNPSPNSEIGLSTDVSGETPVTVKTNALGQATIRYGPKLNVGPVAITADTINATLSDTTTVWFVWPEGQLMQLSAIPQEMPSTDVAPDSRSEILVTLTGGSVVGEAVTFQLENIQVINGSQQDAPYLEVGGVDRGLGPVTVQTNGIGESSAYFIPGRFSTGPVSMATCTVRAEWNGTEQTAQLSWRNDPYLSVETRVEPALSAYAPGDMIDVEIWLKGDGFPVLVTRPIDAMLLMNRGASTYENMNEDSSPSSPEEDKMILAMDAASNFVITLTPMNANMGLTTYGTKGATTLPNKLPGADNTATDDLGYVAGNYPGYPKTYADYVTVDEDLTYQYGDLRYDIWNTTPSALEGASNKDLSPLRYGLYQAIRELAGAGSSSPNPDSETVRAVVLLTDRNWDSGGDPLAGGSYSAGAWSPETAPNQANTAYDELGTWPNSGLGAWTVFTDASLGLVDEFSRNQNLAILAAENDIRVYVIAYGTGISSLPTSFHTVLSSLAESTDGIYFTASNAQELNEHFTTIADDLKIAASMNTTMQVEFISPLEGADPLTYTAAEIFNYTYVPEPPLNVSTVIGHWNWSDGTGGNKNSYCSGNTVYKDICIDQTADFDDDQTLEFDDSLIGTINIKETWMTSFRLGINSSITDSMVFNLFGNNSFIAVMNGDTIIPLPFPPLVITIDPGLTPTDLNSANIVVDNLTVLGISPEKVWFDWNVSYDGNAPVFDEIIDVRDPYGSWNRIGSRTVSNTTTHDSANWFLGGKTSGTYLIRVTGEAEDAGYSRDFVEVDLSVLNANPYILIE
jgi:hypothetical protein